MSIGPKVPIPKAGLAIAQKLVESYHGKISVSSTLGSGSKFMIEFPLLKSESDK